MRGNKEARNPGAQVAQSSFAGIRSGSLRHGDPFGPVERCFFQIHYAPKNCILSDLIEQGRLLLIAELPRAYTLYITHSTSSMHRPTTFLRCRFHELQRH